MHQCCTPRYSHVAQSPLYTHVWPNHWQVDENEHDDQDYLVDHSIVLYLVSPDGQFLDFFTQKMEVGDVVEKVQHYVKEYDAVVAAADRKK